MLITPQEVLPADENLPAKAVGIIRAAGARVRTAQDVHLTGRSDEQNGA